MCNITNDTLYRVICDVGYMFPWHRRWHNIVFDPNISLYDINATDLIRDLVVQLTIFTWVWFGLRVIAWWFRLIELSAKGIYFIMLTNCVLICSRSCDMCFVHVIPPPPAPFPRLLNLNFGRYFFPDIIRQIIMCLEMWFTSFGVITSIRLLYSSSNWFWVRSASRI